jgi:hypothetical protein
MLLAGCCMHTCMMYPHPRSKITPMKHRSPFLLCYMRLYVYVIRSFLPSLPGGTRRVPSRASRHGVKLPPADTRQRAMQHVTRHRYCICSPRDTVLRGDHGGDMDGGSSAEQGHISSLTTIDCVFWLAAGPSCCRSPCCNSCLGGRSIRR